MSNLEHLIENTLIAMEDDKLCPDDIKRHIDTDINLQSTPLSMDDVWELCQYIKYTWCAELEGKIANLEKQLFESNRKAWQWANNYANLLKNITDELLERSEVNEN